MEAWNHVSMGPYLLPRDPSLQRVLPRETYYLNHLPRPITTAYCHILLPQPFATTCCLNLFALPIATTCCHNLLPQPICTAYCHNLLPQPIIWQGLKLCSSTEHDKSEWDADEDTDYTASGVQLPPNCTAGYRTNSTSLLPYKARIIIRDGFVVSSVLLIKFMKNTWKVEPLEVLEPPALICAHWI
jgi:hypothetical protein